MTIDELKGQNKEMLALLKGYLDDETHDYAMAYCKCRLCTKAKELLAKKEG